MTDEARIDDLIARVDKLIVERQPKEEAPTIDLDAIRRRVDDVGDEPLNWGLQGGYWAIAIKRDGSWNRDLLAYRKGADGDAYADLFAHARDDIRVLLAEVDDLRELIGDLVTTLEIVETRPDEAMGICRKEGFVFDGEQGRWQKLAFTLYTELASDAGNASRSIAKAKRALE